VSTRIRIGGFVDLSTVDWHGHLTFIIFAAGCNFKCPFCSNGTLIPLNSGEETSLVSLQSRILRNLPLLDAVGFTGGEPALQPKAVVELFQWAKGRGLKTFLNTNGSNPQLVKMLINGKLVDYVALDVKAPLSSDVYGQVIGLTQDVSGIVNRIKETMLVCKEANIPLEVRTTVVPTLIDDEASIARIARSVKDYCCAYVLQQFYPFEEVLDPAFRSVAPPKREALLKLAKIAVREGVGNVYIRTRERGMEKVIN
jgi:pyruvate formate lyase activating enzyme